MSEKKEVDEYQSEESPSQAESFDANKSGTSETYDMKDFCPGIRIEAKDFDGKWYPAKVSDVDWTENEILVHFENWNTKFDEWIPMDSSRLRPIQKPILPQKEAVKFFKGEKVMAVWSANQKYPGIIQAVLANDRYDVLFSDGFLKKLKAHKISKLQEETLRPEIKAFSDIGTKEERRERKRKINVAELFHINKRSKKKGLVNSKPQEIKTYPVSKSRTKSTILKKLESFEKDSEVSSVETKEEKQKNEKSSASVTSVVNKALIDNIPAAFEVKYLNGQTETWSKQLYQRSEGRTAGKLDIVILNPQGRKFRSRNEIMKYCEENGIIYSHEAFDFSAKGRPKSKPVVQTSTLKSESNVDDKEKFIKKGNRKAQTDAVTGISNFGNAPLQGEVLPHENLTPDKVFIGDYEVVIENGKFICPVKVCSKHFRRENLLHMHMKHYHPEFSKYLDYTPSVTDLAYARTVGNLDAVETPPAAPRKILSSDKLDKSSVRVEAFRRASDIPSESTKEAKKLKTIDNKIETKTHSVVKLSPDISSTSITSAEEPCEENFKNKVSLAWIHSGKNSTNLKETEKDLPDNSENILNGSTNEHTARDGDILNVASGIVKSSRHSRLHSRKKSSRFQGSFSEHVRKRRFLSQDRTRSHNRLGRQLQPQLPGQNFSSAQFLQTTTSPQSFSEDTNSNTPSQIHTMTRYSKPHMNVPNEISGKNILLTNYKTSCPASKIEKNARVSERIETMASASKRSFLAGLLSARKRKKKTSRSRQRNKKDRLKRSIQSCNLNVTCGNYESGRDEIFKKPDAFKQKSENNSCDYSVVNTSKNNEKSQIPVCQKSPKVEIRRLNLESFKKTSENILSSLSDITAPCRDANTAGTVNVIDRDSSSKTGESPDCISELIINNTENIENSPPKTEIKSETILETLPKSYVLLENVLKKKNLDYKTLVSKKNSRSSSYRPIVSPKNFQKLEEKRKRKISKHGINHKRKLIKKVRFENSILENWIDEFKSFDYPKCKETVRRKQQKNMLQKFHLNKFLNDNGVKELKRLDDSFRNEKGALDDKVHSLDQVEGTEDSKSPVTIENDKVEKLRRNEIINCLCGITEEDGLMIQCDICLCWQHGHCAGILRELDVPDKYTCAICKNPYRGRSSMKYLHDQEWLKEGTLPRVSYCQSQPTFSERYEKRVSARGAGSKGDRRCNIGCWKGAASVAPSTNPDLPNLSFRSKRSDIIEQRKTILKRSHDLSGSITLLAQVIHSLRIKVNIAEKKDHPKLWLWAKKWTEKKPSRLKEESEIKEERLEDRNSDLNNEVKKEEDTLDEKYLPKAPEPEAPIDSAECRLNLLDHLIHYQSLIDARLSCIESLVAELESMQDDAVNDETPDRYPRTKATVQMILRDLSTMKKIASI